MIKSYKKLKIKPNSERSDRIHNFVFSLVYKIFKPAISGLIILSFLIAPISPFFSLVNAGFWNFELTSCIELQENKAKIGHFGYINKSGTALAISSTSLSIPKDNLELPFILLPDLVESVFSIDLSRGDFTEYENEEIVWAVKVGTDTQEIALNANTAICNFEIEEEINPIISTETIQNEIVVENNEQAIPNQDAISPTAETQNIDLELFSEVIKEPLLGGNMVARTTLTNSGTDRAYKATIEIDLPQGIAYAGIPSEYLSSSTILRNSENKNYYIDLEPTILTEGATTKLVWNNVTDLLGGESVTLFYRLNIQGSPTFYIDDEIELAATGKLFTNVINQSAFIEKNNTINTKVRAFRIETQSPNEVVTGTDEQFVKDKEINIINNPEENSINEPVIISEKLDSGINYVEGSEKVTTIDLITGDEKTVEHEFTKISLEGGITILKWVIDELVTDYYDNPISINYKFTIPYEETDGITIVEDDKQYSTETEVEAHYSTREEESVKFNLKEQDSVQAKYININKTANKEVVNPGDEVIFTINVKTSQYYTFSNIQLEDELPDGYSFISSDITPVSLTQTSEGKTNIVWNLDNLHSSSEYSFEYKIKVDEKYSDGEKVVSNDGFVNEIGLEGQWNDEVNETRNGNSVEKDSEYNHTPNPQLYFYVWNEKTQSWEDSIITNKNYIVTLKIVAKFPENVPTKNVQLRNYLPPYTSLVSNNFDFSVQGTFEKDPTNFSLENPEENLSANNGMVFEFGNVEASATWQVIYEVEVDDIAAVNNGEVLRNLTRLDYQNHNSSNFIEANGGAIVIRDPQAVLFINNNAKYTNSDLIARYSKISVPETSVTNFVRFLHCDDNGLCDTTNDSVLWSNWKERSEFEKSEFDYVINGKISGVKTICVQVKDQQNMISSPACDSIILDLDGPIGNIVINNGDETTQSSSVKLNISGSDPVIKNSPSSKVYYQISSDGGSWSDWAALDNNAIEIPEFNLGVNFGEAKVYVRFVDEAGNVSGIYSDTIKITGDNNVDINKLPLYKIEYFNADAGSMNYSLDTIPSSLNINQGFPLVMNVQNKGSLVWYPSAQIANYELGDYHPVNISYHWVNSDTGQIYEWNGNRGALSHVTEYSQFHNGVFLNVKAPALPGNYILQIDAVHEGVTWFSQAIMPDGTVGNYMPQYNIKVLNPNPEKNDVDLPDYENDDEFGLGNIQNQIVCTTADNSELYFAPNLNSSQITIIPTGITIKVLNKYQDWYQIKLTDGRIGWINTDISCESGLEEIPEYVLTNDTYIQSHVCNIRNAELKVYPSWDSKTALFLQIGESIFVVEERSDWLKVVTLNGVTGWIFKSFVCQGFNPAPTYNIYDNLGYERPYSEPELDPNGDEYEVGITSDFGTRNGTYHSGVDYGIYCGTELMAVADGTVLKTGKNGVAEGNNSTPETPANYIIILHDDGHYQSWYWHLESVYVEEGDKISQGDIIGTVGNTGYVRGNPEVPIDGASLPTGSQETGLPAGLQSRQGCHLHFEIRANSQSESGQPQLVDVTGDYLTNNKFYPIDPELLLEYGDLTSELTELIAHSVFGIGDTGMLNLGSIIGGVENLGNVAVPTPNEDQILAEVFPIYRFWGNNSNSHFYTIDQNERNQIVSSSYQNGAWKYEGVAFYAYRAENNICSKGSPVHRFWKLDGKGHFYTISPQNEIPDIQNAMANGTAGNFKYEGVSFCAFKSEVSYTKAVYRFYSGLYGSHFYTIDEGERDMVIENSKPGSQWHGIWQYENAVFYAYPVKNFDNNILVEGLERLKNNLKVDLKLDFYAFENYCGATRYPIKVKIGDFSSKIGYLYVNPTLKQAYGIVGMDYFLDAYEEIGDSCNKLGLPISNEYNIEGGSAQSFEFGNIYRSEQTKYTGAVYGKIFDRYIEQGNATGNWGFPRGMAYYDSTQNMYCQEFDGGKLCDYEWGICGNSIIEERIGETCDDGNNVSGDGCSNVCKWECQVGYHRDSDWGGCVKDFLGGSVHPLAVDAACGYASEIFDADDFGDRCFILDGKNYCDFHNGTDIRATGSSCKVNAIASGTTSYISDPYGALVVDVIHNSNYTTRNIHGSSYIAERNTQINQGDYLFYMGCTGLCGGRHLHFELFSNGQQSDPEASSHFGSLSGSGTLYQTTKQY